MVYVLLHTNRTFTDPFFPFFEIIYITEIIFILIFYALIPVALYMLWNSRPFHRNLRLSLCNLVIQGFLGISARLIFIYNQYTGYGPLEERPSVIIASLFRSAMFESFVGVFFFFSFERCIATFAWSWYEKASLQTLIVFIVLESCSLMWSWGVSISLTIGLIKTRQVMLAIASFALFGISVGLFVIGVNFRATRIMKAGARVNKYSVARTFQIRENVVILTALFKIAVSVMFLNVPLFVLAMLNLYLTNLNNRMIAVALFDLIISIYPFMIISFIPLSDAIFERSLRRMPGGERLFGVIEILRCLTVLPKFIKKESRKETVNETDHYFDMLARSLNGPPQGRTKSVP